MSPTERPILFSGEMVRAILDGRKTMTRRVVKPQPTERDVYRGFRLAWLDCNVEPERQRYGITSELIDVQTIACPCGGPGTKLWVRETWAFEGPRDIDYPLRITYRANNSVVKIDPDSVQWEQLDNGKCGWRPSIHMPRWASRITLEVTAVRCERLQEITLADCAEEGAPPTHPADGVWDSTETFHTLWQRINGKRPGCSWSDNPWVWAITFRRIKA